LIYNERTFRNNPLSKKITTQVDQKKYQLIKTIKQKYGIYFNVPIIYSDKVPNNLFGLAIYTKSKEIAIILNKNRFQESVEYMIDFVLPHEYAHALMFKFGDFSKKNGGHTKKWQNICLSIGGKKCDRYVKHQDVIFGKIPY
jgi:predicted SprT family Zn-dependent metalloprotease